MRCAEPCAVATSQLLDCYGGELRRAPYWIPTGCDVRSRALSQLASYSPRRWLRRIVSGRERPARRCAHLRIGGYGGLGGRQDGRQGMDSPGHQSNRCRLRPDRLVDQPERKGVVESDGDLVDRVEGRRCHEHGIATASKFGLVWGAELASDWMARRLADPGGGSIQARAAGVATTQTSHPVSWTAATVRPVSLAGGAAQTIR